MNEALRPSRGAAAEQPHAVGALQREQRDDRAAQVVDRRGEQLVLRERVEQRDRGLVVVRALDQVLGLEHAPQLAVQDRGLGRGLGVGLGREQAEQARLAGELAVGRHAAHADVVHPLAAVHRRARVGLVDDQQLAAGRELAQRLGQLRRAGPACAYAERSSSARMPSPEPGMQRYASSLISYSRAPSRTKLPRSSQARKSTASRTSSVS